MENFLKQAILNKAMLDVVVNSKQYETTFELLTTWEKVGKV